MTIMLWNIEIGAASGTLKGHLEVINVVAFPPNSNLVASGSTDKTVRVWDSQSGKTHRIFRSHRRSVCMVAFAPDGQMLASGSDDATIIIWDVDAGTAYAALEGQYTIRTVAFSADGRHLAAASDNRNIQLWSLTTQCKLPVIFNRATSGQLKFSADCRYLNTGRHLIALHEYATCTEAGQAEPCYGLTVRDEWVACNMMKLLRLPLKFRGSLVHIQDQTVAIGGRSGGLIFLTFDFRNGSPWG
jgi:hypothetical protein